MPRFLISTIMPEGGDDVVSTVQNNATAYGAFVDHVDYFADGDKAVVYVTISDREHNRDALNKLKPGKPYFMQGNNDDCNAHVILIIADYQEPVDEDPERFDGMG